MDTPIPVEHWIPVECFALDAGLEPSEVVSMIISSLWVDLGAALVEFKTLTDSLAEGTV